MNDPRPDPDQILRRIREEEERAGRAKLKIFLGASAGVGKTYAMLVEAHERLRAGADVVVGLVETHGRPETGELVTGLEVMPRRVVDHRGTGLPEFDLDAALARRPGLLLLDELAHTNAPGLRHGRRWQDVEELLAAGIDVATTLNIQHVESLNDVVRDITGIKVRETVPDSILDRADEIEVVDLPPDDLLQRLREGKVYVPEQVGRALDNFFRKGNLIALRELALRQTAQRVDAQMESYRRAQGIASPWGVRERILVCVGDPGRGVPLVRAVRRLASALKAEWIVAHVETPGQIAETRVERDHLVDLMSFAEELGAKTTILSGLRVRDEILAFARDQNVTRVVVGASRHPAWRRLLGGALDAELARATGVDVWVIPADEAPPRETPPAPRPPAPSWRAYSGATLIVGVCTAIAAFMHPVFELSNLAMVYLVGVAATAVAFGLGPAVAASVLSVALFDFAFVPPRFTFRVSDTQYLVTFAVMLGVATLIATLTSRLREQLASARQRERRTAALYRLSHDLAARSGTRELLGVAIDQIAAVFGSTVAVLLPDENGRVSVAAGDTSLFGGGDHERAVGQWSFANRQPAGAGTSSLPGARGLFMPLVASDRALGVIAVRPAEPERMRDPDRLQLLRTFANQIALALERTQLAGAAERARTLAETERARSALLSSVSHDLRTPLAVITGAATSLRDDRGALTGEQRRELAETAADEALRLNRLIGQLLDMTRLEAGPLAVRKDWHPIEEIVGAALARLETRLGSRPVEVAIPANLPLVPLDDVLFEQAVENLIENAMKYSPASETIEITASAEGDRLRLEVADHGAGLPPGDEERVFEKFYRGRGSSERPGVGLGLAIVRGIVAAHGGTIAAANRPDGGAVFTVRLPLEGGPPREEPQADGA